MDSLLVVKGTPSPAKIKQKTNKLLLAEPSSHFRMLQNDKNTSDVESKRFSRGQQKQENLVHDFDQKQKLNFYNNIHQSFSTMEYDYPIGPWNDNVDHNLIKESNIDDGLYISENAMEKLNNELLLATESNRDQQAKIDELSAKLRKERILLEDSRNRIVDLEDQLRRSCHEQNSLRRRLQEAQLAKTSAINASIRDPEVQPTPAKGTACKATQTWTSKTPHDWKSLLSRGSNEVLKEPDHAQSEFGLKLPKGTVEGSDGQATQSDWSTRSVSCQTSSRRKLGKQERASWVSIENVLKHLDSLNKMAAAGVEPARSRKESGGGSSSVTPRSLLEAPDGGQASRHGSADSDFLCSEESWQDNSSDSDDTAPRSPPQWKGKGKGKRRPSWRRASSIGCMAIFEASSMLSELEQKVIALQSKVKDLEKLNQQLTKFVGEVKAQSSPSPSPDACKQQKHQIDTQPAPYSAPPITMDSFHDNQAVETEGEANKSSRLGLLGSPVQQVVVTSQHCSHEGSAAMYTADKGAPPRRSLGAMPSRTRIIERPSTSDGSERKALSNFRSGFHHEQDPSRPKTAYKTSTLNYQFQNPDSSQNQNENKPHRVFRGHRLRPPSGAPPRARSRSSGAGRLIMHTPPRYVTTNIASLSHRPPSGQQKKRWDSDRLPRHATRSPDQQKFAFKRVF